MSHNYESFYELHIPLINVTKNTHTKILFRGISHLKQKTIGSMFSSKTDMYMQVCTSQVVVTLIEQRSTTITTWIHYSEFLCTHSNSDFLSLRQLAQPKFLNVCTQLAYEINSSEKRCEIQLNNENNIGNCKWQLHAAE